LWHPHDDYRVDDQRFARAYGHESFALHAAQLQISVYDKKPDWPQQTLAREVQG
jgi:hypothetical protein